MMRFPSSFSRLTPDAPLRHRQASFASSSPLEQVKTSQAGAMPRFGLRFGTGLTEVVPQATLAVAHQVETPIKEAAKRSTKFFQWCEKTPIGALVLQDIACFNIPPMLLARTKNELLDIAPNLLGWTSITAGSTIALPPLLRRGVNKLTGVPIQKMASELTEKTLQVMPEHEKLARLAVSFGFLFPFGAGFMSAPFFRNYLTLKRAGTSDFEKIIGLRKGSKPNEATTKTQDKEKAKHDPKFQADLRKNLRAGWGVLAAGAALSAASVLGFSALARSAMAGKKLLDPTLVHSLLKTYGLRGKTSNEVSGLLPILLFWLVPPYAGWLFAARSKNERIEYGLKSANSILWFSMFTPMFIKGRFAKAFEQAGIKTGVEKVTNPIMKGLKASLPSYTQLLAMKDGVAKEKALRILNRYSLASWLVPVAALSTTPQLLNIYFTKQRFKAQESNLLKQVQQQAQSTSSASDTTTHDNVMFASEKIGVGNWGTTNKVVSPATATASNQEVLATTTPVDASHGKTFTRLSSAPLKPISPAVAFPVVPPQVAAATS
ncbi:MAG: hypothetical protein ACKO37_07970 [Vampirovibrionales bacterium]